MRKLMLLAIMLALALVLAIPTVAQANNTGSFTNQQGAFDVGSTIDVEVDGSTSGNFTNQQGMYNNRSMVDHDGNRGVNYKIGDARNQSGDITANNGHGKKKKGKRRH